MVAFFLSPLLSLLRIYHDDDEYSDENIRKGVDQIHHEMYLTEQRWKAEERQKREDAKMEIERLRVEKLERLERERQRGGG